MMDKKVILARKKRWRAENQLRHLLRFVTYCFFGIFDRKYSKGIPQRQDQSAINYLLGVL